MFNRSNSRLSTTFRDRFQRAVEQGSAQRAAATLVKPSCLIVDEIGRCVFEREYTALFFDVIDRRYEKERPHPMILKSNVAPSSWDEFFMGDEALLCAPDRVLDKASVFMMRGPSYRGCGLDTYSDEVGTETGDDLQELGTAARCVMRKNTDSDAVRPFLLMAR